jgi:hypothetical protein
MEVVMTEKISKDTTIVLRVDALGERALKREAVKGDQILSMKAYDKYSNCLAVLIPTKKISNKKIRAISLSWYDGRGLRHTRFLSERI